MTGTISLAGAAAPPPGVPDGQSGSPLLLGKADPQADPQGVALSVSWDTSTCTDAGDHQIVWGGGSQLPATPGGTYGVDGSACAIGVTSPFTWNPSPDPTLDALGWVWMLVVATDGATTEGSWGRDDGGMERGGPGAAGSSGQCGMTTKDLTNLCGQ